MAMALSIPRRCRASELRPLNTLTVSRPLCAGWDNYLRTPVALKASAQLPASVLERYNSVLMRGFTVGHITAKDDGPLLI